MLWRLYEYLGTSIFLDLLLQGFESSPPVRQGRVHTPQYPLIVHREEVEHLVSLGLLEVEVRHHVLKVRDLPEDAAAVARVLSARLARLLPTAVTVVTCKIEVL